MKSTLTLINVLTALLIANLRAGEIHDAVAAGDLNKVRALMEADPTLLEAKDDGGNTPLHSACISKPPSFTRPVAVASFLLDRGANVNARNEYHHTALYYAAKHGYLLDQLAPKAVYLMGGDAATKEYPRCVEVLRARNIPVMCPEGGIAMGERFHFVRDQASAAPRASTAASPLSGAYLGQPPPGAEPVVFAPGIVSTTDNEHSIPAFSPNGDEVFWFANRPPGPANQAWLHFAWTMRRENGRWTAPAASPFDGMLVFSPDGGRAYFGSQDDIWEVEKASDKWGERCCLGLISRFPELKAIFMPSVTRTGTLYFIGHAPGGLRNDFGIFRSEFVNGEYAKPQLLPRCINLPPFLNWAPFIAPDEGYLLFSSNRRDPDNDPGDIYISRRLADGRWADPVSLGEPVNTPRQEVFPGLSPDGKYLFFARDTPGRGNDIYWVDAATIPALRSLTNSRKEDPK
jgi:hypothetical protein